MIMGNAVEGNHDYDQNMDHLGWSGQFHIVIKLRIAGMGLMKDALWLFRAVLSRIHKVFHIFDKFVNESIILYRGITPRYTLLTLFTLFTWLD